MSPSTINILNSALCFAVSGDAIFFNTDDLSLGLKIVGALPRRAVVRESEPLRGGRTTGGTEMGRRGRGDDGVDGDVSTEEPDLILDEVNVEGEEPVCGGWDVDVCPLESISIPTGASVM